MSSANWWNNIMQGWASSIDGEGAQIWELRKGPHVATLRVRKTPAGVEIVLTVDGELVRSHLFRADEPTELAADMATIIQDTRVSFEAKGWTA